ncbi:MAG: HAMP domain-containing protein [Deltaproteobacteria bacterium]|nr:HAMP domain-containing protein [Deltaproteobacteria bacterium]
MTTKRKRRRRYPLHIQIATLFILLIAVVGTVLGWVNYRKNKQLLLSASEELFDWISREVKADFQKSYAPVAGIIDLLSVSPLTNAHTPDELLDTLPFFREALNTQPELSGLYVGYDTGAFFMVRPLNSVLMREYYQPPEGAKFVASQTAINESGTRSQRRLYFDADLRELERREMGESEFDPRQRPWYMRAMVNSGRISTKPYLYYTVRKVGITVARRSPDKRCVVACDITLEQLSHTLKRYELSPSSELVLVSADGNVLAYRKTDRLVTDIDEKGKAKMAQIANLGSPVLKELARVTGLQPMRASFHFQGRQWVGAVRKAVRIADTQVVLAMAAPENELLSEAVAMMRKTALITICIILLTLPITWLLAGRISRPLRRLAGETDTIRNFDFREPIKTTSFVKEIDELAFSMDGMKRTISRFLDLITSLAGEQDFDRLLGRVAEETMKAGEADGALVYLVGDDEVELRPGCFRTTRAGGENMAASLPTFQMDTEGVENPVVQVVRKGRTDVFTLEHDGGKQEAAFSVIFDALAARQVRVIGIPLQNRQGEVTGCLCLLFAALNGAGSSEMGREHIAYVEALSGFAAVSMETHQLLKMQKAMLESFIKLIAGAIDAKSPYTGAHCQRVPQLTKMLARAACESRTPPFKDFDLTEEEWEALHIAGWMHDCGKVTTPEYVVDKATKLETIYDRIHEVRMRFEVLKRDAEVCYWRKVADGRDRETLRSQLENQWQQLDQEFAFIAECNEGGEFMSPERVERLHKIAERTWMRTLDDRLGISWEEKKRKERSPAPELPVEERLLAGREEHIIYRRPTDQISPDNPWGFKMEMPEHLFNRDESYNLSIQRGTLTDEERYKINDHIVQTIIMLEKLPYPKHLRHVPALAGGHHEKMDGTGYPRGLKRDDMPVTARIMAIADIFEALTAADRPYKKAKKLSEAIRIMGFMKKENHIDPELFDLFLTSGVYVEYAKHFLKPDQIDDVDIAQYLNA